MAIERHCPPEIFNTDQGSLFTSGVFTGTLKAHDILISMNGKGCCQDNIFIERLWRSVKHESQYIQAFEESKAVRVAMRNDFVWYNAERSHQGLDDLIPDEVFAGQALEQAA